MQRNAWKKGAYASLVLTTGLALLPACVNGIRASDFEQSCSKDEDCVAVEELEADGARCTVPCRKAAIHRKTVERYSRALREELDDCSSVTRPVCEEIELVTVCQAGKCLAVEPSEGGDEEATGEVERRFRPE